MKKNKLNNVKETGFKVPKDYFNNLEDIVLSHNKLKKLSSHSGFKTPDSYFDTLEDAILSQVSEKENSKVISIFSRSNLIYASGIAAAVLLLFNLSLFEKKTGWEGIEAETVEDFIINENIGSYEIAALLIDEELNEDTFTDVELSDEAIETYILENATVEDLIIN